MGIADREYYRTGSRPRGRLGSLSMLSITTWLLIINIAVFVLQGMTASVGVPVYFATQVQPGLPADQLLRERTFRDELGRERTGSFRVGQELYRRLARRTDGQIVGREVYLVMDPLTAWGHFSTHAGFLGIQVWRFITFQFLHANLLHLFFNMFGLWIFGGMVEQYLGSKRYAAFYLTCGVFGALTYLLLNFLGAVVGLHLPGVLPDRPTTPLVGASAGVFGVIMACAYVAPTTVVQLLFPPIPLRLRTFAYGYVAVAALNLLRGGPNAGGDAAHIGGAIAGAYFIRHAHLLRDFFDILGDSRRAPAGTRRARRRGPDPAEVDRILAKVATQGLGSLTDRERRLLRSASEVHRDAAR